MLWSFENEIEWAKYGKFKCNFKKSLTSLQDALGFINMQWHKHV